MVIYISIPISDRDPAKVREKSDGIKAALSRKGHRAVSPLDIYSGKNPTYADHICHALRAMLDCDAVYFCEGWRQSCGCNIEHDIAMRFKEFKKKDFIILYE